ncbi:hypothetical protein [Rhodoferax bucti]|uniref:hypothetical protein n=1 Tax=Rhodoferax bucti TaxID=2576305 RepID=UPI00197FC64A|nr:hypothetical protein [Rhodoferax bucti]
MIAVHQTAPAPALTAGWVRALLEPAAAAAGISNPPPVELRPTRWAGYCCAGEVDRRVVLRNTLHLKSKTQFAAVYIHEVTHRILGEAGATDFSHDARFFALQLYLFARLDASSFMKSERIEGALWVHFASLYDLQNAPAGYEESQASSWQGPSIGWAQDIAAELLKLNLSAEDAAKFICTEYPKFLHSLRAMPAELASVKERLRSEKLANSEWRKVNLQTMFFGLLGWAGLVFCVGVRLWN